MGYYTSYIEGALVLPRQHIQAVLDLYKEEIEQSDYTEQYPDTPLAVLAREHGWLVDVQANGNVAFTFSDDIKNFGYEEWYQAMATYLVNGSYVQVQNEDGDMYRLVVRNGSIVRINPTIIWE